MVVSTMVSKTTERMSTHSASTNHHCLREAVLAVRVGQHPFRICLDQPNPTNLVLLYHYCINTSSSTLSSIAFRHQGTIGTHSPTRHHYRGVRVPVAIMFMALERVLENLPRIGAVER